MDDASALRKSGLPNDVIVGHVLPDTRVCPAVGRECLRRSRRANDARAQEQELERERQRQYRAALGIPVGPMPRGTDERGGIRGRQLEHLATSMGKRIHTTKASYIENARDLSVFLSGDSSPAFPRRRARTADSRPSSKARRSCSNSSRRNSAA